MEHSNESYRNDMDLTLYRTYYLFGWLYIMVHDYLQIGALWRQDKYHFLLNLY